MRRHSPYNYAFDNPMRFIDPEGMAPCEFRPQYWIIRNEIERKFIYVEQKIHDAKRSADAKLTSVKTKVLSLLRSADSFMNGGSWNSHESNVAYRDDSNVRKGEDEGSRNYDQLLIPLSRGTNGLTKFGPIVDSYSQGLDMENALRSKDPEETRDTVFSDLTTVQKVDGTTLYRFEMVVGSDTSLLEVPPTHPIAKKAILIYNRTYTRKK